MRAVVSGAGGMIGIALVKELLGQGHEVVALMREGDKPIEGAASIELELCQYGQYLPQLSADVFFHLAWASTALGGRDDARVQAKNIEYTLDAVELAHRFGCKCFVGAGSQAEYGEYEYGKPLSSASPTSPKSCYGIAKYSAGKLSGALCRQHGIRHLWARILSVYGKHDSPNSLIMYLIGSFLQGKTVELTGCEQIWDYIYCDDAARALIAMWQSGKDGAVYCVAGGKGVPLRDYVKAVQICVGSNASVQFGKKEYYPHQPMYLVGDIQELEKDTDFKVKVGFEEGIAKTLKWYKEERCSREKK